MKKILLFLFLIPVFAAAQKTTGGNYTYIAQRYEWLTGIFQALGMPAGDSAQHKTGQDMRSGAVYLDTVNTSTSPAGFYIYKNGVWELQADEDICQNRLIDPITVTYTGTGMRFFISGGRYQIGCNFYYLDSATVTLADGEADPRIDAIILTASGVDTLKGVAAASPVKPQVDGDQIELTFVNIAAAATTPTIITHIIYDENTESTVTNTGTTTDPDNTSNVYRLTKSINVTDINNNDIIHFTLPAQVNVQEYDAVSGFVDLKAVMSGAANTRVRFFNGATAVSNELIIPINKNSTNWQGWSVPISNFTFSNTYADRVNIRYTNTVTTVHPGFYLDYIHLAGGFTQPGGGGTSNPITMGTLDGKPANSKGATIESNVLYLQTATDSLPGLLSPTLHEKLNNQKWEYFIRNLGTLGDSLATPVNDSTVGIKKLVAGTNVTLTDTDTTIVINSSGGGGGTDNANVGAFYRWLKPTPQEIKTFANGYGILIDSTSNTDALTATADTATLFPALRATISGGSVSGLTSPRIPYASNATTLTDNANFYRIVTPGLQGNTGVVSLGQVALGGSYNLVQNRNFDYLSNGNKSYQLEVIYNKAVYDADSTSSGALGVTSYSDDTGGNSIHSRKARGTQAAPTQVLAGDRLYSLGAKGYTNAGYFSNSSFAFIATADEAFTATANGTSATIEVTPAGTTSRVAALTLANSGAVTALNAFSAGTTGNIGSNLTVGTYTTSPTVFGSQASNGDLVLEGTGNATKTTSYVTLQPTGGNVGIGTTAPSALFTMQTGVGGTSPQLRFNDGDISLPSYSSVGFNPALDATTTLQVLPYSATVGGVQMMGFSESGANTMIPLSFSGYHGGTAPTTPAISLNAWKHNGGTDRTALAASEIPFQFLNGATVLGTFLGSGNFGLGQATPTAVLHLKAGTATASTAPLKFTISGATVNTTAEAGTVEVNSSGELFYTPTASNRRKLLYSNVTTPSNGFLAIGNGTDFTMSSITEGQNINVTNGAGSITVAGPTLTKNATIENPTASENMGWFRTPVAITITNTHAVLVGSSTPSVTYQISFGTDITSLTNVYTAGQTVTSTTTGTAASGVNDATIPANSWIRITTSAQSGTVGQISLSITYTED